MDRRIKTGILIFDEVEVLDFCGPYEVLSVTRLDETTRRTTPSPFDVSLIARLPEVRASGGMQVRADRTLADAGLLDLLVVPGGWGTRALVNDDALLVWLRQQAAQVELLASVCTGSLLLGKAGLLDGRRATTHWKSFDLLQELSPRTTVVRDLHVVEDGNRITSAGISAGIDMALRLVEKYCGAAVMAATARHMEYPVPTNNARRV